MPELPEVETIRAGVAAHLLGATIATVEVYRDRAVRHQVGGADHFGALMQGRSISSAVRRGKFCWLTLRGPDDEQEDYALVVHLGMSGQLLVRQDGAGEHPHLRIRMSMDDGRQLWFVDQRTFGYLSVQDLVPTRDGGPGGFAGGVLVGAGAVVEEVPVGPDLSASSSAGAAADGSARIAAPGGPTAALLPRGVAHIARDLLDPLLAPGTPGRARLNRRIRQGRREIKRSLLDQELVSGIGNIYADEALWRARVHFRRRTDRLRPATVEMVLDAAVDVLGEALAAGGTSFDALYVDVEGAGGYFERSLAVYGREGLACPRCGSTIRREVYMNRSSYYCPRCQRRPPLA